VGVSVEIDNKQVENYVYVVFVARLV